MNEKIIWVVAIIALVFSIWGLLSSSKVEPYIPVPIPSPKDVAQTFGAAGGMLAEQYIPYVRYNGGYKTELSFSVGSTTPKDISNISGGTCNLSTGNTTSAAQNGQAGTFAASTTKMHFCAATGVRVGDQVFVTLPSGIDGQASSSPLAGPGLLGGISLVGAFATTSDIIGVALYNSMAVATGSYSQATTGVRYLIFR